MQTICETSSELTHQAELVHIGRHDMPQRRYCNRCCDVSSWYRCGIEQHVLKSHTFGARTVTEPILGAY
jgi:hypothetical protein